MSLALEGNVNTKKCLVHQAYIGGKESDVHAGQNKEIIMLQTSVIDKERASEQSKRTRMILLVLR